MPTEGLYVWRSGDLTHYHLGYRVGQRHFLSRVRFSTTTAMAAHVAARIRIEPDGPHYDVDRTWHADDGPENYYNWMVPANDANCTCFRDVATTCCYGNSELECVGVIDPRSYSSGRNASHFWNGVNDSWPLIGDEEHENAPSTVSFPPELNHACSSDKRWNSVVESLGVELEGECSTAFRQALRLACRNVPHMDVHNDGSISRENFEDTVEATYWTRDPAQMEAWLKTIYASEDFGVNDSCGFHVHVRVANTFLPIFRMRSYWKAFGEFYDNHADRHTARVSTYHSRKTNTYCEKRNWDARIFTGYPGSRYLWINLMSLSHHGFSTVEHRIFPHQETAEEAMGTLRALAQFIEDFITRGDFDIGEVDTKDHEIAPPTIPSLIPSDLMVVEAQMVQQLDEGNSPIAARLRQEAAETYQRTILERED